MPPPIPDITAPYESMYESGVAVTFKTGADGSGTPAGLEAFVPALPAATTFLNTVTILGGRSRGGDDSPSGAGPSPAFLSMEDEFVASGGSGVGGSGALNGATAATVLLPTYFSIAGGWFAGGNGLFGGTAVVVALGGGSGTISGGSFSGGAPNGQSLGAAVSGHGSLEIAGGAFHGAIALGLLGSGTVAIKGSGLAYSMGTATGTLADGSPLNVAIVPTAGPISYETDASSLRFYPTPVAPFWASPAAPPVPFNGAVARAVAACPHRAKVDCGCESPFRCGLLGDRPVAYADCVKCQENGGDPRPS